MSGVFGVIVLATAIGQWYALAAFPLEVRDQYLGAGPAAVAWLISYLAAVMVGVVLLCRR